MLSEQEVYGIFRFIRFVLFVELDCATSSTMVVTFVAHLAVEFLAISWRVFSRILCSSVCGTSLIGRHLITLPLDTK